MAMATACDRETDAAITREETSKPNHLGAKQKQEYHLHWALVLLGAMGTLVVGMLLGVAWSGLNGAGPVGSAITLESSKLAEFGLWLPNAECLPAQGDLQGEGSDLGQHRALQDCAEACAAQKGCTFFSYGHRNSSQTQSTSSCRREPAQGCAKRLHAQHGKQDVFVLHGGGLTFQESRAAKALAELSAAEVRAVAKWFMNVTGAAPNRVDANTKLWLAGSSAVELLRPPKAATLAYLDGKGPLPERHARVCVVGKDYVAEYKVGPLSETGEPRADARIDTLVPPGSVPYSKRPTELLGDEPLLTGITLKSLRDMGVPLLKEFFGPIFQELEKEGGYNPKGDGYATNQAKNDALSPKGVRRMGFRWYWQPFLPKGNDAAFEHVIPLYWEVDVTSPNVSDWSTNHFVVCHQGPFKSGVEVRQAYESGKLKKCKTNFKRAVDGWDIPQSESPASHLFTHEQEAGVSWGPWSFAVTQRMATGLALFDVRFHGERILYELSLQDAQAAYGGDLRSQFFYADGAWSLSMLSKSLLPGVDCPAGAHYLPAVNWYFLGPPSDRQAGRPDPTKAREFYPICVFEWNEDNAIWRHMNKERVRGKVRKTLVVRTVATVGNYDYITDVKMREDGEIQTETRFAGYIESRHFDPMVNPGEEHFSSIVRPDLAGTVHCHLVAFKADFDIAGATANALHVTEVSAHPSTGLGVNWKKDEAEAGYWSKVLDQRYVKHEGVGNSTFVSNSRKPSVWTIVDRKGGAQKPYLNPRGYAVQLATASPVQVLPNDHPFVVAMPYTKYHLAVTKYHDDEYRVNSAYIHYDGQVPWRGKGAQDLDVFLQDQEGILDQDLVAWICIGKEHIVRQEDLPLVSNFGGGFSLVPWNFFPINVASNPPK